MQISGTTIVVLSICNMLVLNHLPRRFVFFASWSKWLLECWFCIFCSLSYVEWCDELYRLLHISYVRNSTCRLLQLSQVKHLKETWMHQIGTRKPYVQTANLIMYLEFATFFMGRFLISHWTNKSYCLLLGCEQCK